MSVSASCLVNTASACAKGYRALLKQFQMEALMSRRGNCYDNAPMKSFWGTQEERIRPPPALGHP